MASWFSDSTPAFLTRLLAVRRIQGRWREHASELRARHGDIWPWAFGCFGTWPPACLPNAIAIHRRRVRLLSHGPPIMRSAERLLAAGYMRQRWRAHVGRMQYLSRDGGTRFQGVTCIDAGSAESLSGDSADGGRQTAESADGTDTDAEELGGSDTECMWRSGRCSTHDLDRDECM